MSNLLKDASILLTPTGYDNGRMNAIKPYKDLYGPELIVNGDFSNGSTGWTISGSASVGVNKLNVNAGAFDFFAIQTTLTNGLKYKVTLDAEVTSGDILLYTGTQFGTISSSGSYTFYTTSDSTQIRFRSGGSGFVGSITNVSVVEDLSGDFTFTRGSAATRVNAQGLVENVQILSPELVSNGDFSQIGTEEVLNGNFSQEGSELITNGDFATDSDWILTQATISNGSASFATTDGSFAGIRQNVFTVGKTYLISLEVSNLIGTAEVDTNGGASIGLDITTNGTKSFYMKANSTDIEIKRKFGGEQVISATIDNVSVKEVAQNWTLGSGWSIGEDKAISDGSAASLDQIGAFTSGKTYKVVYTIEDYVSGDTRFRFTGTSNENGTLRSANGTYTEYMTLTNNQSVLRFVGSGVLSITNISVKEVGQDWTFGTDVVVGDSVVKMNNSAALQGATQTNVITSGNLCKVSFEVKNYVNGIVNLRHPLNENVSANGVYNFVGNANDTKVFIRGADTTNNFEITNISVKEVTDDTDLPRINYSGFSYQDTLGSELIAGGDFSYDSGWLGSKTIANGQLTKNSTGLVYKAILDVSVKDYKVVVDVDTKGSALTIYLGGAQQSLNVGVNTIDMQSGGSNSFVGFNNGDGSVINSISVKEVTGQEVVPDSGCGSWLLEPQSTNLINYSEDFSDSSWVKSNVTFTNNSNVSPEGLQNATLINEGTATNTQHWFWQYIPLLSGNTYTISFYAKYVDRKNMFINVYDGATSNYIFYDIQNGVVLNTGSSAVTDILDVGNGWYRIIYTRAIVGSGTNFRIGMADDTPIETYTGQNKQALVYGFQLEQQSYATSYIPTNGATSTRLQDIASNSGNSSLINSTEGVLYAEIAALADDGTTRIISLSDGTTANRVNLFFDTTNTLRAFITGLPSIATAAVITDNNKVALKFKSGDISVWLNGTEVATSTSAISLSGLSNLSFNQVGSSNFFCKAKALAVYKEALTDANLRCLTYPPAVATTFDLDFDTIANDFTFTRGSEATFVNEQGLIESTNQIGPELVTNGDFATDSDWTINDWNISGGTLNGSASTGIVFQDNVGLVVGKTYKVVLEISNYTSGLIRFKVGGASYQNIASEDGVQEFYFVASTTANNILFSVQSAYTGSIDNVSVKEFTTATNTPRIDYSTGAKAFLLEPQSTNLIPYSEDFSDSSWVKNGFGNALSPVVTLNTDMSPDGTVNASRIEMDCTSTSSSDYSAIYQQLSLDGSSEYTISFYIKSNTSSEQDLLFFSNSSFSTQITANSEWQRVESTFISNSTNPRNFGLVARGSVQQDVDILIWGAQVEALSYATSYIPTSGASATRNQELCVDATPVINSTEGTLYAEIAALADDISGFRVLSISDGGSTNRIFIGYTSNNIYANVGAGTTIGSPYTPTNASNFHKVALKYENNNCKFFVDGSQIGSTTTSITIPSGMNSLQFDSGAGSSDFFGNTKGLKYYPKALADVQLEDLTTI